AVNGTRSVALFNSQAGQVPAPMTSTSYRSSADTHTLMGVVPGGRYSVTLADGVVRVDQSAVGDTIASAAGVLYFKSSSSAPPRRRGVRH
ncbi:MAG TPA: hypothetical protein VI391_06895, partial [Thermoanaerobaculia bacterium]